MPECATSASSQDGGVVAGQQVPALGPQRLWTRDFVLGTLLNFLILINYFGLMVMTTDYAGTEYGASLSVAGFAASVFIVGALVMRVGCGSLIDRIGRRRLLLAGAVLEVACSLLYLAQGSLATLFALRIVHGCAFGIASTATSTIVTSIVPPARRGEGIGYYMLSVTLGAALGPSFGMVGTHAGNWLFVFRLAIGTSFAILVCALVLRVPALPQKLLEEGRVSLRSIDAYIERSVIPISVVGALVFFVYSSLLTFLSTYGTENDFQAATSWFFVVYAATMFVTRPAAGKVFDRRGHRMVMVPAFLSLSAGMALLAVAPSSIVVLLGAMLLGFGVGTIQSCGLAMAVQAAPDARIGLANSTFYAFLDMGVGVGPLVLGHVVSAMGTRGLYLAMALLAAATLALYLVLWKSRR